MKRVILILKLMEEMNVSLQNLLEAAKCFNADGKFTLSLYVDKDTITDDPAYFEEHPKVIPQGVVIMREIYPFRDEDYEQEVSNRDHYNFYSKVKARGTTFPSKVELEALSFYFKQYRAIAQYFGLSAFTKCVFDSPKNSDGWINYYDLEKGEASVTDKNCPYFEVKHL